MTLCMLMTRLSSSRTPPMPPTVCQALVTAPQCSASTLRGQKTKLQSVGSDSGPDLLNVVVDGNPVDLMESFTYLGSIQTSDGCCRSDITRRIGFASSAISSLNNIWNTKLLSIQTKVPVYQTLVRSILLYASETWTLLANDVKAIESFHMKCQ